MILQRYSEIRKVSRERLKTKSQISDRKPDVNNVSSMTILAVKQRPAERVISYSQVTFDSGQC